MYSMIEVDNVEKSVRVIEAWHVLSLVLPLYDNEIRATFRLAFGQDLVDLLPKFFMACANESVKKPHKFDEWIDYVGTLHNYTKGIINTLPPPKNIDQDIIRKAREKAEKMANAWLLKEAKNE